MRTVRGKWPLQAEKCRCAAGDRHRLSENMVLFQEIPRRSRARPGTGGNPCRRRAAPARESGTFAAGGRTAGPFRGRRLFHMSGQRHQGLSRQVMNTFTRLADWWWRILEPSPRWSGHPGWGVPGFTAAGPPWMACRGCCAPEPDGGSFPMDIHRIQHAAEDFGNGRFRDPEGWLRRPAHGSGAGGRLDSAECHADGAFVPAMAGRGGKEHFGKRECRACCSPALLQASCDASRPACRAGRPGLS